MTDSPQSAALVWTKQRRVPSRRAPSVERIVRTAVEIADAEGLDAVSMRRVATALGSGTASLYRYVACRDDLLDLMIDAVHGAAPPPALTGDWRADLRAVAEHTRATLIRHPWLGAELTGRPALGANSLRLHDIALTAAGAFTRDIDLAAAVVDTVQAYVFGAVAHQLAEERARRRTGRTEAEWRQSVAPYLRSVLDSGAYPEFGRRVREAGDPDPAQRFAFGLECVLDGIATRSRNQL